MTFDEFTEEVRNFFEKKYADAEVSVSRIRKNNGICYTGIVVKKSNDSLAPTIYIDDYYTAYSNGLSLSETLLSLSQIYEKRSVAGTVDFSFFSDYEKVKPLLRCKLINTRCNEDLLADTPYETFMDLAIVPYCYIDETLIEGIGSPGSILIKKVHIDNWDVAYRTVLYDAIENTRNKNDIVIKDMFETLREIKPELGFDHFDDSHAPNMYVLSNSEIMNGAIAMTDENAINDFCIEHNTDVCIIPSSIHEVLLVPLEGNEDSDMLNEMVREVNSKELNPVEILSDHVYYYKRNEGYSMAV